MRIGAQKQCQYGWLPWSDSVGYGGTALELAHVIGKPQAGAVVVAPRVDSASYPLEGPLGKVLPKAPIVTPRGRKAGSGKLVVCLWPDADEIALARTRVTEGGIVLVAEHANFRLDGWARAVGAVHLRDHTPVPPLSAEMVELLDALDFHGNNGYADIKRRSSARHVLAELAQLPDFEPHLVLGAMVARGYGDEQLKRLRAHMP